MPLTFMYITTMVLMTAGMFGFYMWYMTRQPWFMAGNGSSHQVTQVSGVMAVPAVKDRVIMFYRPACILTNLLFQDLLLGGTAPL